MLRGEEKLEDVRAPVPGHGRRRKSSGFINLDIASECSEAKSEDGNDEQLRGPRSPRRHRAVSVGDARAFYESQVGRVRAQSQQLQLRRDEAILAQCTFEPVLSLRSMQLAAQRSLAAASAPTDSETECGSGGESESPTPEGPALNFGNFLARKDAAVARLEDWRVQMKRIEHTQELQGCTFQPTTNSRPSSLSSPRSKLRLVHEELYAGGLQARRERTLHAEEEQAFREHRELEHCTFHPRPKNRRKPPHPAKLPAAAVCSPEQSYLQIHSRPREKTPKESPHLPAPPKVQGDANFAEVVRCIRQLNAILSK